MIDRRQKQDELEALLASGLLREGTQIHTLLTYLGRMAVEGAGPLKEYTIGVAALNKPAGYDPRLDPSARVEVSRLRAKLKDYYARDGAGRGLRLEIPKGGLTAEFVRAPSEPEMGAPRRRVWWAAAAGIVVLAALGAMPLLRAPDNRRLSPELARFWRPHLEGKAPTLLVYGSPLFIKVDNSFYRSPHVNAPDQAAENEQLGKLLAALRPSETRPVHQFTGFGEAEALFQITRLLAAAGAKVSTKRSSNVSWEDLKGVHAVLLGGSKFNPQIPALPYPAKFESIPRRIVNRKPGPGEPVEYGTVSDRPHSEILEEYSLISVYPGLEPQTRLLVLEASSTEGTAAAGEFLTREDTLGELFARMRLSARSAPPRAFQVVVRAKFKSGIPIQVAYATHHVFP